jgi:hypothetical protein
MYGEGSNGKGTMTQTLSHLLDDYHNEMPATTLERSKFGAGIPTDLADLDGKRFVTNAELQEMTVNESRLKALTGRDEVTARFLHEDFFSFIPVCKIWIATNNKPKIVGQDDGIWRRIHMIPFLNKFEGPTDNKKKDSRTCCGREPEHQQGISRSRLARGRSRLWHWYWTGAATASGRVGLRDQGIPISLWRTHADPYPVSTTWAVFFTRNHVTGPLGSAGRKTPTYGGRKLAIEAAQPHRLFQRGHCGRLATWRVKWTN